LEETARLLLLLLLLLLAERIAPWRSRSSLMRCRARYGDFPAD